MDVPDVTQHSAVTGIGHSVLKKYISVHPVNKLVAFAKLKKRLLALISVNPSARNNSATTVRLLLKSDIRIFFENLSRNFKFH